MLPIRDHAPSHRFPLLTLLILLANVGAFFVELTSPNLDAFIHRYAIVPRGIDWSEPTTLLPFLTSMFLHGGFIHIASNIWFLWIFADNVEAKLGKARFITLYLLSGITGSLIQYATDTQSGIPMLGASGAIAGILGAYSLYFPGHAIDTLVPSYFAYHYIRLPAYLVIGYWFIAQLFAGALSLTTVQTGGIAFFAHIGGFVAGRTLGLVLR